MLQLSVTARDYGDDEASWLCGKINSMLAQGDTTRRPGFWNDVLDWHHRLQATDEKIALAWKPRSAEGLRNKYRKMRNAYLASCAVEIANELDVDDEAEQ